MAIAPSIVKHVFDLMKLPIWFLVANIAPSSTARSP